jgi:zeaxanthin glucosyltransferase
MPIMRDRPTPLRIMTHFAIICPSAIGHLNPMCVLGRELQRRNHQVTLFSIPDIRSKVINSGLNFETIGETEFPPWCSPFLHWLEL